MKLPPYQTVSIDKSSLLSLPSTAGIYVFYGKPGYLYIGKSVNIKARVASHFENARVDPKEAAIIANTKVIHYIVTDSEFNALVLESSLIQRFKPPYNSRWKDGKSYLYIKITVKEEFPKIIPVRQEDDGKSVYFGPFSSHREVESLLKEIRKVFPFCTQKNLGKHPCFYAKIGLCNPCPGDISRISDPSLKQRIKRLYRSNIKHIIQILSGRTDLAMEYLYDKLDSLKEAKQYEDAIVVRNRVQRFEFLIHERSFRNEEYKEYNQSEKRLADLLSLLQPFFPQLKSLMRIECYDMSNLYAKQATASLVVATDGLVDKSQYRRFRIRNLKAFSDFEMLEEVLERRLKRKDWLKPDLIVIDGGRPQIRKAKEVLNRLRLPIPLIGIAKRPDRLVIGIGSLLTVKPQNQSPGFNLVRNLRDESHRFARKYHLFLRETPLK